MAGEIFHIGDRVEYCGSKTYAGSTGIVFDIGAEAVGIQWDKNTLIDVKYFQVVGPISRRYTHPNDGTTIRLAEIPYDPTQMGDREDDI
jgi:hypothetical protein